MNFKDIIFGMSAAENEKVEEPNLLIHGFLDENGHIEDLISGYEFLILGPKGSGKSAIGSKLELMSKNYISSIDKKIFAIKYQLEEFPYPEASQILPGSSGKLTQRYWEFIILILLLKSYYTNWDLQSEDLRRAEMLKNIGLFSFTKIEELVDITNSNKFKFAIESNESYLNKKSMEIPISTEALYNELKDFCYNINTKPKNNHYIVLDDLDNPIFADNKTYYSHLSSLIETVSSMNKIFRSKRIGAKIIILSRLDLFENLPGLLNRNKIKADYSIVLDWYQKIDDVNSTNLEKILNLRAKMCLDTDVNIFKDYFPEKITDYDKKERNAKHFLFSCTRYLPRDLIRLMNIIQEDCQGNPVQKEILQSIYRYSREYFVPEIKDELFCYYLDQEIVNKIIKLLGKMERCNFYLKHLIAMADYSDEFDDIDIEHMVTVLYNINAIGNRNPKNKSVTFRYDNNYLSFNKKQELMIHRGLGIALNMGDQEFGFIND